MMTLPRALTSVTSMASTMPLLTATSTSLSIVVCPVAAWALDLCCTGSCWAHGALSALSDRFQLQRKNKFPSVFLAPQHLINCMPAPKDKTQGDGGCFGGDPAEVYPFVHQNGAVHETCQNYQAKNLYPDFKCDAIGICRNCDPHKGCYAMGSPAGQNNFTKCVLLAAC